MDELEHLIRRRCDEATVASDPVEICRIQAELHAALRDYVERIRARIGEQVLQEQKRRAS
jgi:hypothetical protein